MGTFVISFTQPISQLSNKRSVEHTREDVKRGDSIKKFIDSVMKEGLIHVQNDGYYCIPPNLIECIHYQINDEGKVVEFENGEVVETT